MVLDRCSRYREWGRTEDLDAAVLLRGRVDAGEVDRTIDVIAMRRLARMAEERLPGAWSLPAEHPRFGCRHERVRYAPQRDGESTCTDEPSRSARLMRPTVPLV